MGNHGRYHQNHPRCHRFHIMISPEISMGFTMNDLPVVAHMFIYVPLHHLFVPMNFLGEKSGGSKMVQEVDGENPSVSSRCYVCCSTIGYRFRRACRSSTGITMGKP